MFPEDIRNHREQVKQQIFKSFSGTDEEMEQKLEKSEGIGGGEGSRGGKVIGHTKSGKPIYIDGSKSEKYSHQDHYDAFEHHAAITDDWRTRQKHYGKQAKKEALETRQKHLEFSRLHSVAADEGLQNGETRKHIRSNGEATYHTKNDKIITVSNTNPNKK